MAMYSRVFSQKRVFFLLYFLFFICSFPPGAICETLSIQGDKVSLKSNPDHKSKTLWEYGNGFPVDVVKKQGDWLMVKDFENDSGWIHKSRLQKGQQVIVKANKDEEKTINIRSGPSTSDAIVGKAHYGVVFTALKRKEQWLQVRHESGITGWVNIGLVWGL
jgi:SH3-like domain-containing protein